MSIVSRAMRCWRSESRYSSVRILCRRSASLITTTRTSFTIASSILRTFSAWRASGASRSKRLILVAPSTRRATSAPKCSEIVSSGIFVSSTTSCSSAAQREVTSSFMSARMCATSTGWDRKGSPERRVCVLCCSAAKSYARRNSSRSSPGRLRRTLSINSTKRKSTVRRAACVMAGLPAGSTNYCILRGLPTASPSCSRQQASFRVCDSPQLTAMKRESRFREGDALDATAAQLSSTTCTHSPAAATSAPAVAGGSVAPSALFLRGRLGDCLTIFSRIGGSVVHSGGKITLHCLSATHGGGICTVKIYFVAALGKAVTNGDRNTILQIHIAACKSYLPEARSLERFLNIHSEIHDVGNELCVRLCLIEAAHDSERNPFLSVCHETRNDRMQGTLVPGELIGGMGVKAEKSSAILQGKTSP